MPGVWGCVAGDSDCLYPGWHPIPGSERLDGFLSCGQAYGVRQIPQTGVAYAALLSLDEDGR